MWRGYMLRCLSFTMVPRWDGVREAGGDAMVVLVDIDVAESSMVRIRRYPAVNGVLGRRERAGCD